MPSRPQRERRRAATRAGRWLIGLTVVVAAVAVTAGFALFDSPEPGPAAPRLAWFYRPPSDGTPPARIASRHAELILTGRSDIDYKSRLQAAGWRGDVWLYVEQPFTSAPLDGPCGTFWNRTDLWDNQVAWNHREGVAGSNDFCRFIDRHEDWMLHWPDGQRVTRDYGDQLQYVMNPGAAKWREFFAGRVEWALERWNYDAVFLDDVWSDTEPRGTFREYPTDKAYQQAVIGFIEHLRKRLPGVRIIGNAERPEDYSRVLDGWMYEAFAGHWSNELQPADEIVELWELAERDADDGKDIFLVAQGERADEERIAFTYAAYLMVAHTNVSFRYTHSDSYSEFWDSPQLRLPLGGPTGDRRAVGEDVWRREFESGTAVVNLSDDAAEIDLGRDYQTHAGEPVRVLQLPAKAGAVLRLAGD